MYSITTQPELPKREINRNDKRTIARTSWVNEGKLTKFDTG